MREQDFQQQMGRIESQFGKYGVERASLLWREVKDFSPKWFEQVVDRLLGECRQTPLPAEFREDISRERERIWKLEKNKNEKDAKDFFEGTYQPDDKKTICQMITSRLKGNVSDGDYGNFIKMLDVAAKGVPKVTPIGSCRTCDESGYVFTRVENCEYVYRCFCQAGRSKSKAYPVYQHEMQQ